jgi:hypothetical protein
MKMGTLTIGNLYLEWRLPEAGAAEKPNLEWAQSRSLIIDRLEG